MKVGYYEFEGKDRYPEEEETPVKLKRLKEGDKQHIRQIADAELSSQGILQNEGEMPVIQQQGEDLKQHFDKIEELKEDIHKRDKLNIEERFSKGRASSGWELFSHMLGSSASGWNEQNARKLSA